MNLLFICKHNRFRSKVAEAIFNKLNKNKNNKASSAGILNDPIRPYVADTVLKIMKEKGYNIKGKPQQFNEKMLKQVNLLVIVADNVENNIFSEFKGRIIRWNISDCDACEIGAIKAIVEEIEKKVQNLVNSM